MLKRYMSSAIAALVVGAVGVLAGPAQAAPAQFSPTQSQVSANRASTTPAQAQTVQARTQTAPDQSELAASGLAPTISSEDLLSRTLLDSGHVDVFSVSLQSPEGSEQEPDSARADAPLQGASVDLAVSEDVTGSHVRRAAKDVLLHVKPESFTEVTRNIKGVEQAGFALPQTQHAGWLWPGWDSMAVADQAPNARVQIDIEKLTGPGDVFLWQDSFTGEPQSVLNNGLRMTDGSTISQPEPAQDHANWLFTKPGAYQMTARATVHVSESTYTSEPATLTWIVGDLKAGISSLTGNADENKDPSSPDNPNSKNEGESGTDNAQGDSQREDPSEADTSKGGPSISEGDAGQNPNGENAQEKKPQPDQKPKPQVKTPTPPPIPSPQEEQCIPTEVTVPAAGTASGSHTIAANTHVHPNWVFSKTGTYKVSLTQTATSKSGKKLSATGTLTFNVGGGGNASSGHFDVGAAVQNGQLKMLVKDDRSQPATWRNPSELVFSLSDAAKIEAPAGIEFVAQQGTPVWIISATQMQGVPWVGANTQHPSLAQHTTGSVTWTVNSVQGPGAMAVFESGAFGQVVGQRWFGATGNGTAKVFVGKTASGADCELSPEQIAEIEAAGGVVGGRLATTGSDPVLPWLGAALSMLIAGALLIRAARTSSTTVS